MRAKLIALTVALLLGGGLAACGGSSDTIQASGGPRIVVASFGSSESEVLAQIYGTALKNSGANVEYRLELGSRELVRTALQDGGIDLVPEYLGDYLGYLDKSQTKGLPLPDALKALQKTAPAKGITVAEASEAADGEVLAVTKDFAAKNSLKTISDLSKLTDAITLAGPSECEALETCLLGLRTTYGLTTASFVSTGTEVGGPITKKALDAGTAHVGRLLSSDPDTGKTGKYVVLEDDKVFQQAGNIVPAMRTAKVSPQILAVLNKVSKALTTEKLVDMNEKTDADREDPAKVAAEFVTTEKL